MQTNAVKSRRSKVIAVLTVALVALGGLMITSGPAQADPKQYAALTGVGSDTTQDIMNAMAGFAANANPATGNNYTPVQSSSASGLRQVASWDAQGTACITPKAPGATFNRPNGSSAGRRALSRALDGTSYGDATCGGLKPLSGLVNFARSSAPPSGAGTDLTYIPFGRDALSFAYYRASGGPPVTTLTSAQLNSIYTSLVPVFVSGVEIVPCGIQTSSGTYQSWNTMVGATPAQEAAAVAASTCGARVQESSGNDLKARGDLPANAGKQVIAGFSASNFISQSNGVVLGQLPLPLGTINLGAIDALGDPYNGAPPTLTADSTFYASTTYGRDVYNVVSTTVVGGLGNDDFKTMFVGAGSAICSAGSRITTFGFLTLGASCGSITLQGPYVSGTL